MNIPIYSFSIPRFVIKNYRVCKLRRAFPRYLVTPVSITIIKVGEMKKDTTRGIYVDTYCKTLTVLDIYNKVKKTILRK